MSLHIPKRKQGSLVLHNVAVSTPSSGKRMMHFCERADNSLQLPDHELFDARLCLTDIHLWHCNGFNSADGEREMSGSDDIVSNHHLGSIFKAAIESARAPL